MVLGKLFGRGSAPASPDSPPPPADADTLPEPEDESGIDADAPEDVGELDWRKRAESLIPGGASTGSKRHKLLYGTEESFGPTHFVMAKGCTVTSADGDEYIDCIMGLGAVALGYGEARVTNAVIKAATAGNVSGLSSVLEVELAERLCSFVPCAEQAQFFKSGAEAVSAAVRIARVHTSRPRVIASGYFGWHDWASDADGVPQGVREYTARVPFDDVEKLSEAVREAGDQLAAVVLEPVQERFPSDEWIRTAREATESVGALLIFDEIKAGFRVRPGGFQEYSGVTPDLATFGKALANGYPLSAVVGPERIMAAATRSWISSTLASESTALAAAMAVLEWHENADVCDALWSTGREMRAAVESAIDASGVAGVEVVGIDPMWFLRWDDAGRESLFHELALREGLLLKRGAYNYAALAHDTDVLRRIEASVSAALVAMREEEAA
jgi:glutamate-1-semialdehyde 2,1-aminomutase